MIDITPNTIVGDIVRARPEMGRVFQSMKIDFCCGGKKSLAEACAARGLDAASVATALSALLQAPQQTRGLVNTTGMTSAALVQHIVARHHDYLREELPRLAMIVRKVAAKHGGDHPRYVELAQVFLDFASEMFDHMEIEERTAFPLMIELEQRGDVPEEALRVALLEEQHEAAGKALARMRELTNDFTTTEDECNGRRALMASLAQLEADTHEHVHLENNVLFDRARAALAKAAAAN
ncbi:MAG: iron-sulfur cluster repair di-iron protein [Tepidisphaeraceae bacterium]